MTQSSKTYLSPTKMRKCGLNGRICDDPLQKQTLFETQALKSSSPFCMALSSFPQQMFILKIKHRYFHPLCVRAGDYFLLSCLTLGRMNLPHVYSDVLRKQTDSPVI